MATLVIAEHDLGLLSPLNARLVSAVREFGPVDLLVAGHHVGGVAEAARELAFVNAVHVLDRPELEGLPADALVSALESLVAPYHTVVAAASALGRDVIPRLAARLDVMPVTDVIAIHSANRFDRPIYAGNAIETVTSNQERQLLTLRATAFPRHDGPLNRADVDAAPLGVTGIAKFVAAHRSASDTPDLGTARIVVGGGIAVGSAAGFELIGQLARQLGAAIGATRAAVDAGYAPNDWQVGQTGKVIAPDLYIAVGISGALQHLAGIQGAGTIVAINTDAEAPLMKLADIALVGDLFVVLPQLIAELQKRGIGPGAA